MRWLHRHNGVRRTCARSNRRQQSSLWNGFSGIGPVAACAVINRSAARERRTPRLFRSGTLAGPEDRLLLVRRVGVLSKIPASVLSLKNNSSVIIVPSREVEGTGVGRSVTPLRLSANERVERWARRPETAQALALRGTADAKLRTGHTQVARELGTTQQTVCKWRGSFVRAARAPAR